MSIKAETSFSLKDQLFNADTVALLADHVVAAEPSFKQNRFQRDVLDKFAELELKQRIDWMVVCLGKYLPGDVAASRAVLLNALPPPLDPTRTDDDFGKFIWVVPGEYVAHTGCVLEHVDASLEFLRQSTQRFSAENAIRPFLKQFPETAMAFVADCATDANYHVRRLASEGIRPFLPWAPRVQLPVNDVISVLDTLHADPTRYVTRSVANTLNDLSKIDPDAVLTTLQRWQAQNAQRADELDWMVRHALRTQLKAGDPAALALTGYPPKPKFAVTDLSVSPRVALGERLRYQCTITVKSKARLKIALRVHFLKNNNTHAPKVFSVKDVAVRPGDRIQIDKQLPFKPLTTRVLYPGEHFVELVVNGVTRGKRAFDLVG